MKNLFNIHYLNKINKFLIICLQNKILLWNFIFMGMGKKIDGILDWTCLRYSLLYIIGTIRAPNSQISRNRTRKVAKIKKKFVCRTFFLILATFPIPFRGIWELEARIVHIIYSKLYLRHIRYQIFKKN